MLNFDSDSLARRTWHYPVIYNNERNYQKRIIESALKKNTLVCLPTGMGKTFIGLVVMYNFHRWFPTHKVIFMAPTRPLVHQQLKAWNDQFSKSLNIKVIEVTGSMSPEKRHQVWNDCNVFFTTPQVFENDLVNNIIEKDSVVCLIIDEAHKAVGNYSYCTIINRLDAGNVSFRLCALSATPGSTIVSIQDLINNLRIEKIEFLGENSEELKPYTSERTKEVILIPNDEFIDKVKLVLDDFIKNFYLFPLKKFGCHLNNDIDCLNIASLSLISQSGPVEGYLGGLKIMLHVRDLLCLYGINSFISYLNSFETGNNSPLKARIKNQLSQSESFQRLFIELRAKTCSLNFISHPKLHFLGQKLHSHFSESDDTKAMVFSNYRESVYEICQYLQRVSPLLKPVPLLGQRDSSKRGKINQQDVIENFIEGKFNILVSTSIGEEGLDIGYVDLIVFYDAHSSPIRLVQRSGRTGRKRDGKILVLVNENKEYSFFENSEIASKIISNSMNKSENHFTFKNSNNNPVNQFGTLIQMVKFSINATPKIEKNIPKRNLSFKPHFLPLVPQMNLENSCISHDSYHSIIGHSFTSKNLSKIITQMPKQENFRLNCQAIWKKGMKKMPIYKIYNYIPNTVNDYNLFYKFISIESSRSDFVEELPDSFFESADIELEKNNNFNEKDKLINISSDMINNCPEFDINESELDKFDWSDFGF